MAKSTTSKVFTKNAPPSVVRFPLPSVKQRLERATNAIVLVEQALDVTERGPIGDQTAIEAMRASLRDAAEEIFWVTEASERLMDEPAPTEDAREALERLEHVSAEA